jgi:hypothetical protein
MSANEFEGKEYMAEVLDPASRIEKQYIQY